MWEYSERSMSREEYEANRAIIGIETNSDELMSNQLIIMQAIADLYEKEVVQ